MRAESLPRSAVVLLLLLTVVGPSCSQSPEVGTTAEVKVALVLPSGLTITTITYEVATFDGPAFIGPATFVVSDPAATVSLDIAVPPTGVLPEPDVVIMSAVASNGETCAGSSAYFDVTAGTTTNISLTLTCGTQSPSPSPGSVDINASVVNSDCPIITSAAVAPDQAKVGFDVSVTATASTPEGEAVSYVWSPVDFFADPTAASTSYVCLSSGTKSIGLTVTNDSTGCSTNESFTVECIEAQCGDGIVETGEQCDPPDGFSCSSACQLIWEPANCESCEQAGTVSGICTSTSPPGQGASVSTFGCEAFTNLTDRANCIALLGCLRGSACQGAIQNATPDYQEAVVNDDDPRPCLCGNLAFDSCIPRTSGYLGVCAAQYLTAAAADGAIVTHSYFDSSIPIGVANALFTCDIDNSCQQACGIP